MLASCGPVPPIGSRAEGPCQSISLFSSLVSIYGHTVVNARGRLQGGLVAWRDTSFAYAKSRQMQIGAHIPKWFTDIRRWEPVNYSMIFIQTKKRHATRRLV